ncbi:MAG: hypothetical protein VX907_01110 [Pseudomonadota bacterium]|nr:hypothetical protein [Pseudomonadota bacterium]
MALFGPSDKDLKQDARKEYDKAVGLKGDTRKEHAYRMRIGLRARSHIDKLFIDGAKKAEKYNETVMLNISQGKKAPAAPTTNEYMKLVSASGEVWSYLPEEYAQLVFKYGMQYQSVAITGPKAIHCVQKVSNAVAIELKLDKPLIALEFLREQLTAEGVDVDGEIAAMADDGDGDDNL